MIAAPLKHERLGKPVSARRAQAFPHRPSVWVHSSRTYPFKTGQGLEVSERLGNPLRSDSASRVRIRGAPGIGQEFAQPIGGMSWQPLQDVFQVGERIDPMTLAMPSTPSLSAARAS